MDSERLIAIALMLMISTLTGCGSKIGYSLPNDPNEFNTSIFANPSNEVDEHSSGEYKGREYIPYGTLKGSLGNGDVGVFVMALIFVGIILAGMDGATIYMAILRVRCIGRLPK